MRRLSLDVRARIGEKCQALADAIREQTTVDVDTINDGIYFATFTEKRTLTSPHKGAQQFPWHQDHENFWQWQDNKNYLNFYVPIIKPCLEQSNLAILPFDKIRERNPTLADKLEGMGATRVLKTWRGWVVRDDNRDRILGKLGFDPSEIQEIPHLRPGDLVLLRGDVIHCTQDSSTRRIAISIRMMNSRGLVSRARMVRGGVVKALMMFNFRSMFGAMLQYFEWLGAEQVTVGQLNLHLEYIHELEQLGHIAPARCGRISFIRRLVREKLRTLLPHRGVAPAQLPAPDVEVSAAEQEHSQAGA